MLNFCLLHDVRRERRGHEEHRDAERVAYSSNVLRFCARIVAPRAAVAPAAEGVEHIARRVLSAFFSAAAGMLLLEAGSSG